MTLPILSYGHPVLRQKCERIDTTLPDLDPLIDTMWKTMHGANGCGLAASQLGKPFALFIVDSKTTFENLAPEDRLANFPPEDSGIEETFINARIVQRSDEMWEDVEGCLSIPGLSAMVKRPWNIEIEYLDRQFKKHRRKFSGLTARMIQHEYDHTQGILYLDHLSPLTRARLEGRLRKISRGHVHVNYPMRYVKSI